MGVTRPDVELHVDALVLEGFAPRDRAAIGEALRAELARLILEGGLPPSMSGTGGAGGDGGGAAARLDGGTVRTSPGQSAADVGAAVARAVYGSRAGGAR